MSDIKVVLYKEDRTPRSIAVSSRMVYRTLLAIVLFALLFIALSGAAARFYWLSKAKVSPGHVSDAQPAPAEPSGSLGEQNATLRDEVELLKSKIQNAAAIANAPREIDKANPALALFAPIVVDKTKNEDAVKVANFRYSKGADKKPSTLTFELHNGHPGEAAAKGYIVVLARSATSLQAYPSVFAASGPYLLDFEKGETFQVARFREVSATFDEDALQFQVLIFSRNGELLINTSYEVKNSGNDNAS